MFMSVSDTPLLLHTQWLCIDVQIQYSSQRILNICLYLFFQATNCFRHLAFATFGFSSSSDRKTTFTDKHSVLCELSQHILFQYVFMVIWFAIALGICASSLGVILQIGQYVNGIGIRQRIIIFSKCFVRKQYFRVILADLSIFFKK